MFQFHSGLIKRAQPEMYKDFIFEFQFHSGLIKSAFSGLIALGDIWVSIPFWSD